MVSFFNLYLRNRNWLHFLLEAIAGIVIGSVLAVAAITIGVILLIRHLGRASVLDKLNRNDVNLKQMGAIHDEGV